MENKKSTNMVTRLKTFLAAIVFSIALASCTQEINDYGNRLDDLESRVSKLEQLCKEMNSNISSLQAIVTALQTGDYITSVTPITSGDKTIGYTISFVKGDPITIYHGQDGEDGKDGKDGKDGENGKDGANGKDGVNGQNGQDGHTPVIGVKQDTDGIWYWTVDGEWLLDGNGQKVKAVGVDGKDGKDGQDGQDGANGQNGQDGKDGKDGVTPQLKIEDGYWYVSTDNGQTWTQLGKATGENGKDGQNGTNGQDGRDGVDGDSMFQSVTVGETEVTFVTSDGQTFVIKRAAALSIEFDSADLVVMGTNSSRDIHYTITSGIEDITIEALSSADIKVKVLKTDSKTGALQVKTGATIDEYSKVVVLVSNVSQAIMHTLTFEEQAIRVEENTTKEVTEYGGEIELEFFSNVPCHAVIPPEAQSWISITPETKVMTRQTIGLTVQPNTGSARSATVIVQSDDGSLVLQFLIEQQQKPESKALLPYEFLPNEIDKTTITEAYFHVSDPTTTATIISSGDSEYEPIYFEMTGTVAHFYTTGRVYKCNNVNFSGWDSLCSLDLSMFDVSDLHSFYPAFQDCSSLQSIDLSSFDTSNCIDFGGMFYNCKSLKNVDITNFDTSKAISMGSMFENCSSIEELDVSKVDLSSVEVTSNMFSGCLSLKHLDVSKFDVSNVTRMNYMFSYCSSLQYLDVSSWDTSSCVDFDSMFYNCSSLKNLDVSSWDTSSCTRLNSMFSGCSSLETLDVSHFNTANVEDFNSVFTKCWNLQIIDVSDWKMSKAGYTRSMFADCKKLREVNLSGCELGDLIMTDAMFMNCSSLETVVFPESGTPKLQNMENMFYGCSSLNNISFNGLSTSNVTTMRQLFTACSSLKSLDLSSFETAHVTSMYGMFMGCSSLKKLDLSNFDTRNVSDMDYMFSNCFYLSDLNLSSFTTSNTEHASGLLEATYNLSRLDMGNNDWSAVNLNNALYSVAKNASQCHIRCAVETKNRMISIREDLGTNSKFVWYNPNDLLPDNVDGKNPNLYYSSDYSKDRTILVKQTASEGNGIDIVIMGDGYSDRLIADGTYDVAMNAVIDAIFAEEPYKSFKQLFNIYVVYAVSENEVIGENTAFMSYDSRQGWAGAIGAYDQTKAWAYANSASKNGDLREMIPIVVLNSTISDGVVWTTTFYSDDDYTSDPIWDDYHGGESMAFISGPFNSDISYTVVHEMGHAFGKLADEYTIGAGTIDDGESHVLKSLCNYGMYKNIDFTCDFNLVKWKHYLNDPRYTNEGIGCYEGAANYEFGVWRPTDNSIMRDDANGHYNAPSREAIYYRIHKLAYGKDWQYNFEDFAQWDLKNIPTGQQVHISPKLAPKKSQANMEHLFKMEKSIAPDGRKRVTIIMD